MTPILVQRRASVLLETVEEEVYMVRTSCMANPEETPRHVNAVLDTMDELVQRYYDRYIPLESEDFAEACEDHHAPVHIHDIQKASGITNDFLIKIISGRIHSEEESETWEERASALLAHLSGRGASGAITRTWHIPFLNDNGDRKELKILIHEPPSCGLTVGLKTWGAAPFFAQKLLQDSALSGRLQHRRVLELGSGTGLVGLVCDKLGAAQVRVTDYQQDVLENVKKNVALNGVNATTTVAQLDFIKVARQESAEWQEQRFDLVIASDLLYEMEHAEHLPVAVNMLMENEFYFLIPLRSTHWNEVNLFERRMAEVGLHARVRVDSQREEDEGMVSYRYYEFTRTEKTGL